MIERAIFTLRENHYGLSYTKGSNVALLGLFLCDDLGAFDDERVDKLVNWALSDDTEAQNGNISFLEKYDDTILLEIGYLDFANFGMLKEDFVWLLREWKNAYNSRPKKIIIKWDGRHFSVNGKKFSE